MKVMPGLPFLDINVGMKRHFTRQRRWVIDREDDLKIAQYREEIDRLDLQLLKLMNERAACALGIGTLKKKNDQPIFVPEREKAVLERLKVANKGPLDDEAILALFETVFEQMKKLEKSGK